MFVSPPTSDLVDLAKARYRDLFGADPQWGAAAPGRVNLIGEHTDYNDGYVMPMAIERSIVVVGGRPADQSGQVVELLSQSMGEQGKIDLAVPVAPDAPRWTRYIRGVLEEFRALGGEPGPLRLVIESNVPLGAGLSSSAALEVATATLLEQVTGVRLSATEKARLCQRAENIHVGVPCGIMDQYSSAAGMADHLMLLDCRSLEARQVPFTDPAMTVLLINTNVQRELASSAYPIRRAQCETAASQLGVQALRDATMEKLEKLRPEMEEVVYRRARHVISENQRVLDMASALAASDWTRAGELMVAGHDSLRDDYAVSCPELDLLVDTAFQIGRTGGVIGSRMTGAGFGGCTITLVESDAVESVAERITKTYRGTTGIEPTAFTTRPGRGAHVVDL